MKRIGIAVLSAASLLAAGTAAAAEPQWNYGQIGWIQGDGFEDAGESDGFKIDGSIGFLGNYHAQLAYRDGDSDVYDSDDDATYSYDFDGYDLTLGFHQAINSSGNTQFIANINYFDTEYDIDDADGNLDNTGYGLGFGLRSMISEKIELEGMINWTNGELDIDGGYLSDEEADYTNTTLSVGGRYHWLPSVSTGLTIYIDGSNDSNSIGGGDSALLDLRYSFGSDISK
jgi:opacity protein-like surface antigen